MSRTTPPAVSLSSRDGRLRVDFHWQQDRFVHHVFRNGTEVGASVEGDTDDSWPPSPPLQQLSLEEIDGTDVILGVGSAGRGHWSISVEPEEQGAAASIKFELACRSKLEPPFLGTTYLLDDSVVLLDAAKTDRQEDHAGDRNDGGSDDRRRVTVLAETRDGNTYRWTYRLAIKNSYSS